MSCVLNCDAAAMRAEAHSRFPAALQFIKTRYTEIKFNPTANDSLAARDLLSDA
jgi:hypothetical protein